MDGKFKHILDHIADRPFRQYGTGSQSISLRRILGFSLLTVWSKHGNPVNDCHFIISGVSQGVIGFNLASACHIEHINCIKLHLLAAANTVSSDCISITDCNFYCYVRYQRFVFHDAPFSIAPQMTLFCATVEINSSTSHWPWKEDQKIVVRVHKHFYEQTSYSDVKIILERRSI